MNKYINSVDFFKARGNGIIEKPVSLILAAYHLRTPENLGAIIRLASNLNIKKVFFIQDTGILTSSKIARVAHSGLKHVDYSFCTSDEFFSIIPSDFATVAVETSEKASNLFSTELPQKCVLIFGNERYGIEQQFLNRMDKTVFIPLLGKTLSLNVSHAATIAAFEWARQHFNLEKF